MYAQKEKPKENKSRAVANSVIQKKSVGKQALGFADNRPEAIAQRKYRELVNTNQQAANFQNFYNEVFPIREGKNHICPIQCCTFCGNSTCKDGEKCKPDKTFGGLFNVSATQGHVGLHKHTKKHSKRKKRESEHVLASQSIKKAKTIRSSGGSGSHKLHSGSKYKQDNEFTISIPYDVHRGGVSGAGGGISSTGRSTTATDWANHIGGMLEANPYDAVRNVALEHLNAYFVQNKLHEGVVNNIWRWIDGQVHLGRITNQEANQLKELILQHGMYLWELQYNIMKHQKKGPPGGGKGGGMGGGLSGGILVNA